MKINLDTRTVTPEQTGKRCRHCYGSGRTLVTQSCPTNGRGPKGGKDGCKTCHGMKRHYDPAVTELCPTCNGINSMTCEPETLFDHVDFSELFGLLEFKVVDATDTRFTELGLCLASSMMTVGDYGDHVRLSDDELIADVRNRGGWTQWVQCVRREDNRLADAIVVVRRSNGYSVRAEWSSLVSV